MTTESDPRRPPWLDRTPWPGFVVAAVILLSALVATSTFYRVSGWAGAPGLLDLFGWQVLVWAPWLALAVGLPRMAERFPFEAAGLRDFAVHLVVSFAMTAVHVLWFVVVSTRLSPLQGMEDTRYGVFKFFFVFFFQLDLLLYWVLVGFALARAKQRAAVERERRQAQLEVGLAQARLRALQLQIRPHFLFNTLNTVVSMQRQGEIERATSMLLALSDMLRRLLAHDGHHTVSVRDELALLEPYLEIEAHRFGDRLQVVRRIDPRALSLTLPTLSLQPLVENAIRHGCAAANGGTTRIDVSIERDADRLSIEVANPAGSPEASPSGLGIGHDNLRGRVRELFGDEGLLELDASGGMGRVRLSVPARESAVGAAP